MQRPSGSTFHPQRPYHEALDTAIEPHFEFFFFSSRRRHTMWPRDWSSDVCSSDLVRAGDHRRVDLLEVRCLEAFGIGAAQAQAAHDVPGGRDLRLGDRADVRIMLEAAGELELDVNRKSVV